MPGHLIFSSIGQLATLGLVTTGAAYALFRFFGQKWIEHELAKNLEAAKSEINLLAARRLKLHDREYVVFPDVWSKLDKAYRSLGEAVASVQITPDLNSKTPEELAVWIDRSSLTEGEREFVAGEKDKNQAIMRIQEARLLDQTLRDFRGFHDCFRSNRIFIQPAIKEKLDQIDDCMRQTWAAKMIHHDGWRRGGDTDFLHKAWQKYNAEVKPLILEIESLVQTRLFPQGGDKDGANRT